MLIWDRGKIKKKSSCDATCIDMSNMQGWVQ